MSCKTNSQQLYHLVFDYVHQRGVCLHLIVSLRVPSSLTQYRVIYGLSLVEFTIGSRLHAARYLPFMSSSLNAQKWDSATFLEKLETFNVGVARPHVLDGYIHKQGFRYRRSNVSMGTVNTAVGS